LRAPVFVGGHLNRAEGIGFGAGVFHGLSFVITEIYSKPRVGLNYVTTDEPIRYPPSYETVRLNGMFRLEV
jgi:hypothetical protein